MSNENGHWYTLDGQSAHTQVTKTKGAKPTRPTTIADAKRLGLLPSVSAYTRMLAAPYLERYKMLEVAKACYACPPAAGENYDDYARHILEQSSKDGSGAAEVGTQVHAALDLYFTDPIRYNSYPLIFLQDGSVVPADSFVLPAAAKIKSMGLKVETTESILVNPAYGQPTWCLCIKIYAASWTSKPSAHTKVSLSYQETLTQCKLPPITPLIGVQMTVSLSG